MTKENKKSWNKPQLIILVRTKPGESVLLGCKNIDLSGPAGNVDHCQTYTEFPPGCIADLCLAKGLT